jgi:hypothetical protein
MYEGDPDAIKDALDKIPEEARDDVAEMAPRLYAAYAETLYATPTPPRESAVTDQR